jgi:Fe-S-cluster containining protein
VGRWAVLEGAVLNLANPHFMKRAIRKRAGKLRSKALESLAKLQGGDLQTVSNRISLEQYCHTLARFEDPTHDSLGQLAQEIAANLMHETANQSDQLEANYVSEPKQREIDCGAGCAWCCHEPLQVSVVDAISVASFLLQDSTHDRSHLESYVNNIDVYQNRRAGLKESFAPCPFLSDDKRCQVYEARPVICRAFHSTDVFTCRTVVEQRAEDRSVPMFTALFGFRGLRLSGTRKALREMGLDDRPVVLATAVKLLMDDFDSVVEQWFRGEPVFDLAAVKD